jgi:hypothetical protein
MVVTIGSGPLYKFGHPSADNLQEVAVGDYAEERMIFDGPRESKVQGQDRHEAAGSDTVGNDIAGVVSYPHRASTDSGEESVSVFRNGNMCN